jgi:hypothetical protein
VIVITVVIAVVIVIAVPIALGFPALVSSVPPLVILIPATIPFCIQIAASLRSLVAVLAILLDRLVQPCFRLADCVLAVVSIIGVGPRGSYKKQQRAGNCRRG